MSRTINRKGIECIRQFLLENYSDQSGRRGYWTPESLQAWAKDAQFQLDQGNPPIIELKSYESVSRETETFEVPEDGIDEEKK